MLKKMMLMAMSVGALIAFAAPAAQANVSLSDLSGQLSPGAEVTATSTNLKIAQTGSVTVTCITATLFFEVVASDGDHVELEQTQTATTFHCTANNVLPVTITNGGVTQNLTINTWGTANVQATFISQVFQDKEHKKLAVAPCDYLGVLHIVPVGATGTDTIEVTKSALVAAGCPEAHMEATFTLETPTGARVNLNYTATL